MNLGLKTPGIKSVLEALLCSKNEKCLEKVKPTLIPAVKQTHNTYHRNTHHFCSLKKEIIDFNQRERGTEVVQLLPQ